MLLGRSRSRWVRTAGLVGVGWALARGASALTALCSPAPWVVERYKYEALAETLPTEGAERWLDVGCGTGRSLVGVAGLVPDSCRVLGLDVFDDRIVLGNTPGLAAWNARRTGLDAATVRGDATRLPVGDRSHGVVTACRLLHDLPRERALETLSELERVCAPDAEG
ncbi:MAG: methyltransferase type 11, partial [Halobacteriales archaeon SW_9_67_25]